MSPLDNIIQAINDSPDKGSLFEKLCLYFLRHDPTQQTQFADVWPWHDWPGNNGERDTGIDIVAQVRDSETYCAVQCKFRQDDATISKSEIDSFLARSSTTEFSARIIFTLTGNFNDNASNALKGQSPKVTVLTRDALEASNIDWSVFIFDDPAKVRHNVKSLRPHQIKAVNDVLRGLALHDRGKLIMACGTGKTYTSLQIAEKFAGKGGAILVLVPSISLLNQTVIAWNNDHQIPMFSLAVCSDKTAGRKDYLDEDMRLSDLAFDATTNVEYLIGTWERQNNKSDSMTVIFSTYQSLSVIRELQQKGFPCFDLVICDEAHRTAGVTLQGDQDSSFRLIHDDDYIHARKRLYMTATPKIFGESPAQKQALRKKAAQNSAELYSMDDESIYGPEFHRLSFSQAVNAKLLTDYKVMIFMVREDESKELTDLAKIIGVCDALAKKIQPEDSDFIANDTAPMQRAVNFTGKITQSQAFTSNFPRPEISLFDGDNTPAIRFTADHVDGTMSAGTRAGKIQWLAKDIPPGECRILSNARCLSEGVDVPALDAVIFFTAKHSEIDIVQSVGRVMRKAEGKNCGYVILPVAIKPSENPETELDKNEDYRKVWKVLQALRAHDDHFNAIVNSLDLNQKNNTKVRVIGGGWLPPDDLENWRQAVYVRIVRKCGDREYWDKWVTDLATVAKGHSDSLQATLKIPGAKKAFNAFADDLRRTINPSISDDDALEMLAQHIVSKRVFDELFTEFSSGNPISIALQRIISTLNSYGFKADDSSLEKFYDHVHEAVKEAKTDTAKQELIRRIYDHFFRVAFKKTAQKLGIVYTPVEIVDFILRSSAWAVRKLLGIDGFNGGLSSGDVQILDPFSGTGTFTVRLIQSGIIPRGFLTRKYNNGQIYANEILLLPYYISAVNIEAAFSQLNDGEYTSFPGIVLTDTFNLNGDPTRPLHPIFHENGERAYREELGDINVIIGNPPYSVGQKSANDNNKNTEYPHLKGRINDTYAKRSTATLKKSLYDSYILAIRWASDRLKDSSRGVICFVTNGSFIDSNSADGMRKCLADDFAYIFVYNLRGNQRAGNWRKEGEKVFGEGSQCAVAITMMVKDARRKGQPCEIRYYECGDGMKRAEKLAEVVRLGDFGRMIDEEKMTLIAPNKEGDWINQRMDSYWFFWSLGNKREERPAIFSKRYSLGLCTARDAWCCNFSRETLCVNMAVMISVYNSERERWHTDSKAGGRIEDCVTNDPRKISWTHRLYRMAEGNEHLEFEDRMIRVSLYRPYVKEYVYLSRDLNERVYQMLSIFPKHDTKNLVICVSGIGSNKDFSVLMTDCLPMLDTLTKTQCFPLYWYEEAGSSLLGSSPERRNGISRNMVRFTRVHFGLDIDDESIAHEDLFYYIYGVLSSREYAERFGSNTKKMLARVPLVKDADRFREFLEAGRKLGALHVNYESAPEYTVDVCGDASDLRVSKMKIAEESGEKVIRYNAGITLRGIPREAWEYRVNGRSALEWIVERYRDDVDKASGLRNDCNAWGEGDYVLRLIRRVITVSVETVRILGGLPELGV